MNEKEAVITEWVLRLMEAKRHPNVSKKTFQKWVAGLEEIEPAHYPGILWTFKQYKKWPKDFVYRIHMIDLEVGAIIDLIEPVEVVVPKPFRERFKAWWARYAWGEVG